MTDAEQNLRRWAAAYRDGPREHRFPSDPDCEFFPQDLERAADDLDRLTRQLAAAKETNGTIVAEFVKLKSQLAEARELIVRMRTSFKLIDRIAINHEKGGIGKAQRLAREALAHTAAMRAEEKP